MSAQLSKRLFASLLSVSLVWSMTPVCALGSDVQDTGKDPTVIELPVEGEPLPDDEQGYTSDVSSGDDESGDEGNELLPEEGEPSEAQEDEQQTEEDQAIEGQSEVDPSATEGETETDGEGEAGEEGEEGEPEEKETPGLSVVAHVQSKGWLTAVGSGQLAGTSGKSLRVEALKISLTGEKGKIPEGSIQYQAHVQSIGWQGWTSDGQLAGTSGKSLRVEALKIRLTGEVAELYDVYYQVHVQKLGWLSLAKNGEAAGTSGKSYRIEALRVWLVKKGEPAPSTTTNNAKAFVGILGLQAQAHVQKKGWLAAVGSGGTAGTTGQSLRIEALKLSVTGLDVTGDIMYRAHVQSVGWQGWKMNGQIAGTTGRGLRVEALEVKLTGELADTYDVYYRTHISHIGWLGWAKNGESAGSSGMSQRVEAIQVKLVAKGASAPSASDAAYADAMLKQSSISYAAFVQNASSWQGYVSAGKTAGTTGKGLWVEGLRAKVSGDSGSVLYRSRIAGGSWTSWAKNGEDLLTSGKRFEIVQLKLSGNVAVAYDIWYRAHVQGAGWSSWGKNGASVGSDGLNYRIEAVQVKILPKGSSAPGETYRPLITKSNLYDAMTKKAQGYSSPTKYLIMVDVKRNYVGIYEGYRNHWVRIKYVRCSSGWSNNTVLGTFSIGGKSYSFTSDGHTLYWVSDFYAGSWAFHSVLYYPYSNRVLDGRLGYNISGGCIRLATEDAKWIYNNVPYGSTVVTYR